MAAAYGVLATALVQVAFFNAVRHLPVSVALLVEYAGPVLVIGWVWAVQRQPPGARTLAGGGLAGGGLTGGGLTGGWLTGGGLTGGGLTGGGLTGLGVLPVSQVWSAAAVSWAGLAWRIGASLGSLVGLLEVVASAVARGCCSASCPPRCKLAGGALVLTGVALAPSRRRAPAILPT